MSGNHTSTAPVVALRDTVLADRALLARLSTIADQEAVLDELMAVANANKIPVDSDMVRQAMKEELTTARESELSDEELEMVAAGATTEKGEKTGGRTRPAS